MTCFNVPIPLCPFPFNVKCSCCLGSLALFVSTLIVGEGKRKRHKMDRKRSNKHRSVRPKIITISLNCARNEIKPWNLDFFVSDSSLKQPLETYQQQTRLLNSMEFEFGWSKAYQVHWARLKNKNKTTMTRKTH